MFVKFVHETLGYNFLLRTISIPLIALEISCFEWQIVNSFYFLFATHLDTLTVQRSIVRRKEWFPVIYIIFFQKNGHALRSYSLKKTFLTQTENSAKYSQNIAPAINVITKLIFNSSSEVLLKKKNEMTAWAGPIKCFVLFVVKLAERK